jgi:hypothetical protein
MGKVRLRIKEMREGGREGGREGKREVPPMVRPSTLMLSVLRTPWVKPTACQAATRAAVLATTSR